MIINEGDLEAIRDEATFVRVFANYAKETMWQARLIPRLSLARVVDAHGAWCNDLERVKHHEKLEDDLDHFKRCGHLCFWLRRASSIVEAIDPVNNLADAEGMPLSEIERDFRDLLFPYANEYLAFDFGLQFCKFYEMNEGSQRARDLLLNEDYLRTVCKFMKYKNVSPHALFLIYKSLFWK
jgi:hypothetical protein